jgi:hypothetical protein
MPIMPRLSRIDYPGLLQYVIGIGVVPNDIFINDKDREDFIRRFVVIYCVKHKHSA